jgi:aspartate kinase
MPVVVLKFGGTSVADPERIKAAAEKCVRYAKEGKQVAVVVSAMAGETDRLLNLAKAIDENPSPRELDMIASTGEQVSIALMAIAIEQLGVPAISFTGPQIGMITDGVFTSARIKSIDTAKMKAALDAGRIVIVAGFQGMTEDFDITTLGRGGSDTSAVALAAVLEAERCYIYTDVDGVYAADPRIVPGARRLDAISYDEMLELASAGAKVLYTRAVEFAKKYGVPLVVLSSLKEGPGTLVEEEVPEMEQVVVSGITANDKEAKISLLGVPDKPGMAAKIFGQLADSNVVVDMIVQSESPGGESNDISFTVEKGALKQALDVVNKVKDEVGATEVVSDQKVVKLSAVGVGMRTHAGVAARMFDVLAQKGINIQMISTSEIKISCVINEDYKELAIRALCEAFDLAEGSEE